MTDQTTARSTTATCPTSPRRAGSAAPATTTVEDVTEAMKDVVDPELGINVVDLGLVYDVHLDDETNLVLDMTLTSAACPLTDVITDQTESALEGLVNDVAINWVWMPPWGPGQDHPRRPRAAPGAGLQRLKPRTQSPVYAGSGGSNVSTVYGASFFVSSRGQTAVPTYSSPSRVSVTS